MYMKPDQFGFGSQQQQTQSFGQAPPQPPYGNIAASYHANGYNKGPMGANRKYSGNNYPNKTY